MKRILCLLSLATALFLISGCSSNPKRDYPVTMARFVMEARPGELGTLVRLPVSGTQVSVSPKSLITEYDYQNVEAIETELGPYLMFSLTSAASRDLFRITATNVGSRLVLLVNGTALGARRIERPFGEGVILVHPEVDPETVTELATNLTKTSTDMRKDLEKKKK